VTIPRIRSERPAFDLKFPEVAAAEAAYIESEGAMARALGPAHREPVSEADLRADDRGTSGRPEGI
jgi:hypothetical protein